MSDEFIKYLRVEFHNFINSSDGLGYNITRNDDASYVDERTDDCWDAFKAGAEAADGIGEDFKYGRL